MSTYTVRAERELRRLYRDIDLLDVPQLPDWESVPFRPDASTITYELRDGTWYVKATVFGPLVAGTPGHRRTWADFQHDPSNGPPEHWPPWLQQTADQLHPARPGGWPGDDPEGSYL